MSVPRSSRYSAGAFDVRGDCWVCNHTSRCTQSKGCFEMEEAVQLRNGVRMGNYDYYVYQSPKGTWHFRILDISEPRTNLPDSDLESKTEKPEGYDSKQT